MRGHVCRTVVALAVALWAGAGLGQSAAPTVDPGATTRELVEMARKAGAKGTLPNAWWDLESQVRDADAQGAAADWNGVERQAARLLRSAEFLNQMRQQKSGLEALLGRYDQSLAEIGALFGVEPDPLQCGSAAATDLLEKLMAVNLRRQVEVDSLRVSNRRLSETVGGHAEALEAQVASQKAEITALRKQVWDLQLRAGAVEAERSAAEGAQARQQDREAAVAAVRESFTKAEAEVVVDDKGAIVLRVFGLSFGSGSADLGKGQEKLIGKIADAVSRFPGAAITVDGHTDNKGGHEANLKLSQRRAAAVARVLEKKLALGDGAIATNGYGPDRPLVSNGSAAGRARNRRIDVVIVSP